MKTFRIIFLLLPFALITFASAADLTSNPTFQKNCVRCHGDNAQGKFMHGPSLTSKKVAEASPEDLEKIVTNGKGHMPKFGSKLSPEEIHTLVEQVKALNTK